MEAEEGENAEGTDSGNREILPMSDSEVKAIIRHMRTLQLATDQRRVVTQVLTRRTLTCAQAGVVLEAVRNKIVQRLLAFEELKGKLSDVDSGLRELLRPLSGPIREDVARHLSGSTGVQFVREMADNPQEQSREGTPPIFDPDLDNATVLESPLLSEVLTASSLSTPNLHQRRADWVEPMERLRAHVENGQVRGAVHKDLSAAFDALGLRPLQAPPPERPQRSKPPLFPSAKSSMSRLPPPPPYSPLATTGADQFVADDMVPDVGVDDDARPGNWLQEDDGEVSDESV
mmetsp:Transcript_87604/g.246084  ORF Transcript_87604/g.246084 Transcript_87604/m.246084 type:complete len:289 (-) Transcript_87604:114-980(-)